MMFSENSRIKRQVCALGCVAHDQRKSSLRVVSIRSYLGRTLNERYRTSSSATYRARQYSRHYQCTPSYQNVLEICRRRRQSLVSRTRTATHAASRLAGRAAPACGYDRERGARSGGRSFQCRSPKPGLDDIDTQLNDIDQQIEELENVLVNTRATSLGEVARR